jgi:hypothetical protein
MKAVSVFGAAASVTAAVKRVEEKYVVGSTTPFITSTAPLTNPEPFTVTVEAPAPNGHGSIEAKVGTGLLMINATESLLVGSATEVAVMVT